MKTNSILMALALTLTTITAGCDGGDDGMDAGTDDASITPPECPSGTAACGEVCVNTDTNRSHCGACDAECDTGEACIAGACGLVCPSGQQECSGACVDVDTDRAHCGACGATCDAGEVCVDGACALSCPGSQVICGSACVDTTSNPAHCGGCDMPCDAGQVCSGGTCAISCGAGLTECSAACVDTDVDPDHCGDCATSCTGAAGASGLCIAGSCRTVCDALMGDCNGDLAASGGDGCETNIGTDVANCGACGRTCSLPNAVVGCTAGSCSVASCDAGFDDCDGSAANGCETDVTDDDLNCGACGTVCGSGEGCIASVCETLVGEDCATAVALSAGLNTVAWTAGARDYLGDNVSCATQDLDGPDVVLSFTASSSGEHTFEVDPPTSTRWAMVVSAAACGTVSPERGCASEFGGVMDVSTFMVAGQTIYIYLNDTTSGGSPLDNPVEVTVTEPSCTTTPAVVTLDPADGTTATSVTPTFTVDFDEPVSPFVGTITLTGDMGGGATYDLTTDPLEVSFDSTNTEMTITPAAPFASGEEITVSWTGMLGYECGQPVASPTWLVDARDCAASPSSVAVTTLEPADASTTTTQWPTFGVSFDGPIVPTVGTITISGDMGTSLTYDLSTRPDEVAFSSSNDGLLVNPDQAFPAGEALTISWTGIVGATCGTAVTSPTWSTTVVTPPCTPGSGGVVGRTSATITGPGSFSEYYVAADEDPSGYVYVGGTLDLFRVPKAGGAVLDIYDTTSVGSTNLGYDMLIDGMNLYTLDTTTSSTGRLYRISTDGGATYSPEDFASFSPTPADGMRGMALHDGRIYMVTNEATAGVDTEIWSVDAGATSLPAAATLERTVSGEIGCTGIARDDSFYYLACAEGEHLVRVPVGTGAPELITDQIDISFTNNQIHGEDLDTDGVFDVLYLQTYRREVNYVCDPAVGTTPFWDVLARPGSDNATYGLGFDSVANVLWYYDADAEELVSIQ